MTKKLFFFAVALILVSCGMDTSGPSTGKVPENDITDISRENIPLSVNGGDPRGEYFANEPLMIVEPADANTKDSTVSSTGKLYYVFEGDSPESGDFTIIEKEFDLHIILIKNNNGTKITYDHKEQINHSEAQKEEGTWKVEDGILQMKVDGNTRSVKFTANDNGLFFYNEKYDPGVGAFKTVMAYKKQK